MVLRQESIHEIHNLVQELDNNLSFGGTTNNRKKDYDAERALSASPSINHAFLDPTMLEFEEKKIIGTGTFATVYKCQLHGTDIAVKVFETKPNVSAEVSFK